jgi:hypothetical protein
MIKLKLLLFFMEYIVLKGIQLRRPAIAWSLHSFPKPHLIRSLFINEKELILVFVCHAITDPKRALRKISYKVKNRIEYIHISSINKNNNSTKFIRRKHKSYCFIRSIERNRVINSSSSRLTKKVAVLLYIYWSIGPPWERRIQKKDMEGESYHPHPAVDNDESGIYSLSFPTLGISSTAQPSSLRLNIKIRETSLTIFYLLSLFSIITSNFKKYHIHLLIFFLKSQLSVKIIC